jgi:hypothetical protein
MSHTPLTLRILVSQDAGDKRKVFLHDSMNASKHSASNSSLHRSMSGLRRPTLYSINVESLDLLGEMIFGSVPLTLRGLTTKFHYFKAPDPKMMLSTVFSMPAEIMNNEEYESLQQKLHSLRRSLDKLPSSSPMSFLNSFFGNFHRKIKRQDSKNSRNNLSVSLSSRDSTSLAGSYSSTYMKMMAAKFNYNDSFENSGEDPSMEMHIKVNAFHFMFRDQEKD